VGLEVDVLFMNGRTSRWSYLLGYPRFWWRLLRGGYDVVHSHYILAGLVARTQWSRPVVLTHHGCEVLGYPRWQTLLARLLTPLFDEVIYTSEEMRAALGDADGWVVPCGIDLQAFTPERRRPARTRLGLPPSRQLVLWAGEPWRPEKRFHLVLQAMERVNEQLPGAELIVLAGKPHSEVPSYMNACDVLVLTSAAEGSPMVVKEAMACNLPVVSTRVGDVAEVLGDTANCYLADSDPDDLAGKLIAVLQQPNRTSGRTRVEHLGHEQIALRLLGIYTRSLTRNSKFAPGAVPPEVIWPTPSRQS